MYITDTHRDQALMSTPFITSVVGEKVTNKCATC